ncbi:MAG: pyridoxal-phosphate dependent enzyme [Bacteroidota bacterium]
MTNTFRLPSPIQKLEHPLFRQQQLDVFIKRDDQIHPFVSGNKWRKLKYNLQAAQDQQASTLLTLGGAFSNHIAATAVAGSLFDFQTVGIIRGEILLPLNPTLQLAVDHGMKLYRVSRKDFRERDRLSLAKELVQEDFYFLPEGGTNELAVKGCAELVAETQQQLAGTLPDYFCTCCGTGGTLAGIVQGLGGRSQAIGVAALKGNFLGQEVQRLLHQKANQSNSQKQKSPASGDEPSYKNWQIFNDYHFGGYAKFQPALIRFINQFKSAQQIPLDPIYTGKLFYAIFDLIEQAFFPPKSRILIVHTGGLQGVQGFNQRFGNLIV